jgi:hypothetical protein
MRRPKRNIFYKMLLFRELLDLRREMREEADKRNPNEAKINYMWEAYSRIKKELKNIK